MGLEAIVQYRLQMAINLYADISEFTILFGADRRRRKEKLNIRRAQNLNRPPCVRRRVAKICKKELVRVTLIILPILAIVITAPVLIIAACVSSRVRGGIGGSVSGS